MKIKTLFVGIAFFSVQTSYALELKECRIGTEYTAKVKAECGKVTVAENRSNPSRMIDLNVAIVRTVSKKKQMDPVIMLAGGPGQSAVESFPQMYPAFRKILKDRDVVLVDQRGTGHSNPLKCEFDDETQKQLIENPELIPQELQNCANKLDADTRFYTTPESIKDLEEVRKALAIEKWNLLGISYGTRKALTYMKMFPESIRSVILDGVMPQQEAMPQSHEKNLVNALRKQFELCKNQPTCNEAFGDVEQQMWQVLDNVEENQPKIRLQNFMTGEYDEITVNKQMVAIAIRMFAYTPDSMRLLPLIIAKANHGQLETIASQGNLIGSLLSENMSNVEISIICAEDAPFYDEYSVESHNLFGEDSIDQIKRNCEVWPHSTVDADFKEPVVSDLPVLLLSGELDPVTPPEFAELAMQTLSNSQHLVAKGQGHNVFPKGCMPDIITQFINNPEDELDTKCMSDFDYEPFFINMMGPKQ
jgi:pimeloyl-ACP methyl ester carboxylesterase